MKIMQTLAVVTLMLAPSIAAAECGGTGHVRSATINCVDGKIVDDKTGTCVPVSG